MNNKFFHYSSPIITHNYLDSFSGTLKEKNILIKIFNEWNSRVSVSQLCNYWRKVPLHSVKQNLIFLLYNVDILMDLSTFILY